MNKNVYTTFEMKLKALKYCIWRRKSIQAKMVEVKQIIFFLQRYKNLTLNQIMSDQLGNQLESHMESLGLLVHIKRMSFHEN